MKKSNVPDLTNLDTMLKIQDLLKKLPPKCLATVSQMVKDQIKQKSRAAL